MSGIAGSLDPRRADEDTVWIEIPQGFASLPTEDIVGRMTAAETLVSGLAPDELRATVSPIGAAFAYFLQELTARGVVYCGIGRHQSTRDATTVTSSLTVSLRRLSDRRNPRLLLVALLNALPESGEGGQVDLLDVAERPTLFVERLRDLPTPYIPGQPNVPDGGQTTVYQLEAVVPSGDGGKLVAIELSTPFAAHGPEFRAMVVGMVASVSFEKPVETTNNNLKNVGRVLSGGV